jgi:uncharacterized membrane protein (DUF441 family)
MYSTAAITFLGVLLGMRHATDADHVIAVSTIVSRERKIGKAGLVGAIWGMGHTLTIFFVGSAMILFKAVIPERLGLAMETSVGLMLIIIGALNLSGALQRRMKRLTPNDALSDSVAGPAWRRNGPFRVGCFNVLRPLAIGVVHGLAGSAAIALLVMATIHDLWVEMGYLLVFGFGTAFGMIIITVMIAVPIVYSANRMSGWNLYMITASGLISICFGVYLSYQNGFASGLFTAHPHWIPQ